MSNVLYCGDNLEVLEEYVPEESIDLVYIDPPFNSQRTFNVVYKDSRAQERAFKDYWSWAEAASTYVTYVSEAPIKIRSLLNLLHDHLVNDDPDMLAYVTMMAPRIVALHRSLKPTGTLWLHCDPTASHYLRVMLDAIFGPDRFLNEVVWKRTHSHGDPSRHFGAVTDSLLVYTKSKSYTFNPQYRPFAEDYAAKRFNGEDEDGRMWQSVTLRSPNPRPNLHYPYPASNGVTYKPHKNGWSCEPEVMARYDRENRLHFPTKPGGQLRLKMYLDESKGVKVQSLWEDIPPINSQAVERVGWPTQKPLALLDRVIRTSSNDGDLVLDAFCGCGTTVLSAERTGRRWIGIDIAQKGVEILEKRFKDDGRPAPSIVWHPADLDAAVALADRDKEQFEVWVRRKLRLKKRPKDRGIDGECYFKDIDGKSWHTIVSVKGGKMLNPAMVRELRGTIEREHAAIGVLVCAVDPSREMRLEATRAEFLPVSDAYGPIPRIQIVTVEQLLREKRPIRAPGDNQTPKQAPTLPQRGQTGMLFPATSKARPAQEARAKHRVAPSSPTLPLAAVAGAKRPSSKPPKG
jgi:site-specific DNA-methyltransferase (adenine-specific)